MTNLAPPALTLAALLLGAPLLADDKAAAKKEGPIQDNSFLVEEAYNQEEGVVQHISTFTRFQQSRDWIYTFTQEWPVGSQKHQLSYSLPIQSLAASPGGRTAVGDVALNYRYQLLGDGDAPVAISPRLSILLPTGNEKEGYGRGNPGIQANVPVSFTLGPDFVGHFNVGATQTPKARDPFGNTASTRDISFGQSFVWLATPRFNMMLEYVYTRAEVVLGQDRVERAPAAYLNPGIRWAYNFPSGLQIVPGLAFPIGVGPSRGEKAVFLYLSFEHPFKK